MALLSDREAEEWIERANTAEAEVKRLLHVMAAALERTQVDDSGEATFILEREVNLDGTRKEKNNANAQ